MKSVCWCSEPKVRPNRERERRKINLTGESTGESAEDGQHLPLTLYSYTNVYVAYLCAYLSIYRPPREG
ncbi:MAG: hypothetical protein JGK17_07200 [Microcoleus sp. PH2017_10_PVI_O_A]|uniref:hypothetical protein n=1 Tax=unclassified Microcoleus TaxID=2642155 RepID=UPI001DA93C58|nr:MULTISPECIES: hypothetical protein [unclassified Microcoleus]MCC3405373.1 hypothetical protein [Microcoleus sp. PH2017_10_PVI_O_A]MCC3459364.1 hypothetical protein [Microcoleus sp. PH2017_11_PCY_U_A]MCC3477645.1 hypothetical protein [Microcoleus sp. PH2017_12_PCY_D_A]MCC3528270.1 hypothetical protein [Microcoleus sp. PH2017_21_RUC_O_A]MCC3540447.1 hypothetical protein [Microcoleus sp. PH2017_22_RUC_O_B]